MEFDHNESKYSDLQIKCLWLILMYLNKYLCDVK